MNLLDFFDKAYVINLPHRKDRRRAVTAQLRRLRSHSGRTVEVFPGIRPREAAGFPGPGVRGCFLSHLSILKAAKKDNLNNVLVLEDDLRLTDYLIHHEEEIMEHLARLHYDFVYFGHCLQLEQKASFAFTRYTDEMVTTHFMGINATVFDRLIDYLETVLSRPPGHPLGGPMHVDGAYNMFRDQNPDVVNLVANPLLGFQRGLGSDITPKWYDQGLLGPLANTIRSLIR